MAALPAHPRIAHMLVESSRAGLGALAADIAALLAERDLLRWEGGPPSADLRQRLDALREGHRAPGAEPGVAARVRAEAAELRRAMRISRGEGSVENAGAVLALAYPDRVARRRAGSDPRYLLVNGSGAYLDRGDALSREEFLVIAETDGAKPEARIVIAAPISREGLEREFALHIEQEDVVAWDRASGAVAARRRRRLGAIVLDDAELRDPAQPLVRAALLEAIRNEGVASLPWSEASVRLRHRLAFARTIDPAWPDVSDAALHRELEAWLGPHLDGVRRRDDLARVDLGAAVLSLVPWDLRSRLDTLAPTHITVPTGSRVPVNYADPRLPVLAVRLQELFGLAETPAVGGGRVPLTLHLLSPAGRPVQVTRDLGGFWKSSYFDVRKDLRGRYPKHAWPEDPMNAEPTRKARRRGN